MEIPFLSFEIMHKELSFALRDAMDRVIESNKFILGEECRNFEREYADFIGTEYCIGVGNGLDAIKIILMAMGIGTGDEIIVPANTFIATALAVSQVGAKPILVEPDISSYNIDISRIEKAISRNTKAIIAVHLQGRPADMDGIRDIAERYGIKLIEDAAQGHGARYKGKRVGSMGYAAAFSFYPGKNLGALGDGGAITTDSIELCERIREFGNYGSKHKYHHVVKGTNSRLDELQAAVLRIKLKELDRWNNERRRIAKRYISKISNPRIILPMSSTEEYEHIYHVFAIRCDERDRLEYYLKEKGIETVKHYPVPIHLQKAYADLGLNEGSFPVAEKISKTILSIPIYYGMTDEEVEYVIGAINRFK